MKRSTLWFTILHRAAGQCHQARGRQAREGGPGRDHGGRRQGRGGGDQDQPGERRAAPRKAAEDHGLRGRALVKLSHRNETIPLASSSTYIFCFSINSAIFTRLICMSSQHICIKPVLDFCEPQAFAARAASGAAKSSSAVCAPYRTMRNNNSKNNNGSNSSSKNKDNNFGFACPRRAARSAREWESCIFETLTCSQKSLLDKKHCQKSLFPYCMSVWSFHEWLLCFTT